VKLTVNYDCKSQFYECIRQTPGFLLPNPAGLNIGGLSSTPFIVLYCKLSFHGAL